MARLTAATRNRLPASAFAGPARSFPIQDESHARAALSRVTHKSPEVQAEVKAKVRRRYPSIAVEGEPSRPRADRRSRKS